MEYVYALLNYFLPDMGPWNDPIHVFVAFPLTLVVFFFFMKWMFFGGLGGLLDALIFKALDKIPTPPPMTDREKVEFYQRVSRQANMPEPQWSKMLGKFLLVITLLLVAIVIWAGALAIVETDWSAWYEERKVLIWFLLVFIAFITVSSIGAWIDKKGKLVSIPVFLAIVGVVCFVVYRLAS